LKRSLIQAEMASASREAVSTHASHRPTNGRMSHAPSNCRTDGEVVTLLHLQSERSTMMAITTISSREFNQDTSSAKKAARLGPVIITDRGKASHVLLSIEEYQELSGTNANIVDLLVMPEAADIEFETERAVIIHRPVDLS
jgi:prevent-host-death family protein